MVFSNFHSLLHRSPSLSESKSGGSSENRHLPPRKRYRSFTLDTDTAVKSTPRIHQQFAVPKDVVVGSASRTINTWRKLHEINLLKSMIEYHNKNGMYPFADSTHMQNFYKGWIKRNVYVDEDVFTTKMVELPERFFRDQDNVFIMGPKLKAWMPPLDVKIYELSHMIWGNIDGDDDVDELEDDHDDASVIDPKD
ncbi:hypothetical protein R6Q57_027541 [Mikania cordata]